MSRRRPTQRSYIMRGPPIPTAERPTVADPPDYRLPDLRPRKLSLAEIEAMNKETATDPRLRAISRCFERWAATPTDSRGPSLAHVILIHREQGGGAVPLDDVESKIVDAVVRNAPAWARNFVHLWYRSDMTIGDIAKALCMKRYEHVHAERHIVLGYFMGRLSEATAQLNLNELLP